MRRHGPSPIAARDLGGPSSDRISQGGAWRWPTIRVGYSREVLPGVMLTTIARQPALFELTMDPANDGRERLTPQLLSDVVRIAEGQLEPSLVEGRSSLRVFLLWVWFGDACVSGSGASCRASILQREMGSELDGSSRRRSSILRCAPV